MRKLTIVVNTTNFEVKIYDKILMPIIRSMFEHHITYTYVYSAPKFKGAKPSVSIAPDKMYYAADNEKHIYRFNINSLRNFMLLLGQQKVSKEDIDIKDNRIHHPAKLNLKMNPDFKPKPYQKRYINALTNEKAKNITLIDLIMGYGKAQPLTSKIKVPYGWATMDAISIGDEVIAKDGSKTTVSGYYPQGIKSVYKVVFEDGRSTEVTGEHLWKIYHEQDDTCGIVIDTIKMFEILSHTRPDYARHIYIDLPDPEERPDEIYTVDPLDYGVGLSNGSYDIYNGIPDEYKIGSTEQRYRLIRGYLSSRTLDVFCNDITLSCGSDKLAYDIVDLCRSLGCIASSKVIEQLSYDGTVCTNVISITAPFPERFFYQDTVNDDVDLVKLQLTSITYIGKKECACIAINHPDKLYVTDEYITTHNTFISLYSVLEFDYRTIVLILPKYIEKWIGDLKKYTQIKDEDIYVVQGGESLTDLMNEKNIKYKFIICSLRTMINYIKDYNTDVFEYPVKPQDLVRHLKVGTVMNDESHQEFHAVFTCMLYFDPLKFVGMTATIDTNDKHQAAMYEVLFPKENRVSNLVEYIPYINVCAIQYTINSYRGIHWRRAQGYNHILYEQSIMRNRLLLREYLQMILFYVKTEHMNRRVAGDKIVIFASMVNMCKIIANFLQKEFPTLNVKTYVEEDPLENILTADITASTPQSSGTALDIPMLITVLHTVSTSSMQANQQNFGRLREIPDKKTNFVYFYCKDIKEHRSHNKDRLEAIRKLTNEFKHVEYHNVLKSR